MDVAEKLSGRERKEGTMRRERRTRAPGRGTRPAPSFALPNPHNSLSCLGCVLGQEVGHVRPGQQGAVERYGVRRCCPHLVRCEARQGPPGAAQGGHGCQGGGRHDKGQGAFGYACSREVGGYGSVGDQALLVRTGQPVPARRPIRPAGAHPLPILLHADVHCHKCGGAVGLVCGSQRAHCLGRVQR